MYQLAVGERMNGKGTVAHTSLAPQRDCLTNPARHPSGLAKKHHGSSSHKSVYCQTGWDCFQKTVQKYGWRRQLRDMHENQSVTLLTKRILKRSKKKKKKGKKEKKAGTVDSDLVAGMFRCVFPCLSTSERTTHKTQCRSGDCRGHSPLHVKES